MSTPNWTSNSVEYQEGSFPEEVSHLWHSTRRVYANGNLNPVFGEGTTWYWWDETWTDACGPFESEVKANEALSRYCREELGT